MVEARAGSVLVVIAVFLSVAVGFASGWVTADDDPPASFTTVPVVTVQLTPEGFAYCPENRYDLAVQGCVKR